MYTTPIFQILQPFFLTFFLDIIGIFAYYIPMIDETQNTPLPNPPAYGATQHEISRFIWSRNDEKTNINQFYSYKLFEYLAEAEQLPTSEILKTAHLNNHFASQLHQMQTTLDYLLLRRGDDELKNAMMVQRRFCETLRVMHKIKTDNRKLKQKQNQEPKK